MNARSTCWRRRSRLGWGDRAWMETDSDLEPVREHPRFTALLARIGDVRTAA